MHKIKVVGGTTASDQPSLCESCRNRLTRTLVNGRREVFCQAMYYAPHQVTQKVVECSDWRNANQPSLSEMRDSAWILRTSSSGAKLGFVSAREYKERYADNDPNKPTDDE